MQIIVQNEPSAVLRSIFLPLVDSTTFLPKTSLTAPSGRIFIGKAGATTFIAHTGTFTELTPTRGVYSYVFALSEIDTVGPLILSYSGGGCLPETQTVQIIPANIYSQSGLPANVTYWATTPVPTPNIAGHPLVDLQYIGSSGVIASGVAEVSLVAASVTGIAQTVWNSAITGYNTAGTFGESNQPSYQAMIEFNEDDANSRDEYTSTWFKNGMPVALDSVPGIQVIKRADGTTLVSDTAMTQIAGQNSYSYNATNRLGVGEAGIVNISGLIGGVNHLFSWIVSRDNNA